eukprot:1865468-Prymnesium_polylepis.2
MLLEGFPQWTVLGCAQRVRRRRRPPQDAGAPGDTALPRERPCARGAGERVTLLSRKTPMNPRARNTVFRMDHVHRQTSPN